MSNEDQVWVSIDWSHNDGSIGNLRGQLSRRDFDSIVTNWEEMRWIRIRNAYWIDKSTDEKTGEVTVRVQRYGRGDWRSFRGDLYIRNHQVSSLAVLDPRHEREFLERHSPPDSVPDGWP